MGAFDNYKSPSKGGGAFDNYKPTTPAPAPVAASAAAPATPPPAAPVDIGTQRDPNWQPSGNALLDFFTRPVAKTEDPFLAAKDYGLSAYDAATFGYGVPSAFKDAVTQAHQNLGLMDYAAQGLGYAAGPGKILGPLARGAAGAAGLSGLGGSIAAGGLEGAGAGGLGAAGHGGDAADIAKSAAQSGAGGALFGVTGGMGPKPKAPEVGYPQSSTAPATGMYAQKTKEYSPLDSIYFDNPTTQNAINQAQAAVRAVRDPQGLGADLGIPKSLNERLMDLQSNPVVTGRNLQEASADLRENGGWTGHRFADALDNVLNTAQPLQGGQPGEAGAAKLAGDLWTGRIKDLERLGTDPGELTNKAIEKTQGFYPQESPQGQALTALAKANEPAFNWFRARHLVAPLAFEGAAQADQALDPERTAPWVSGILHGAAGAALFEGLPRVAAPRPGAALNAARYAIGTGQPMTTATGRVGDYLANLLYGHMAGQ
jgi:hypothetical protein